MLLILNRYWWWHGEKFDGDKNERISKGFGIATLIVFALIGFVFGLTNPEVVKLQQTTFRNGPHPL
jgi:uncharacterized membrane protein YbjE (DUF340 family)